MATEVKVPAMGESITSGILSSWHVKDGDFVKKDQVLYELETDKITSEATAEADGKISLKVAEGEEVEIGAVVAVIDESATGGDSGSSDKTEGKEDSAGQAASKSEEKAENADKHHSPAVRRIAGETGINPDDVKGSGKDGRVTKGDMLEVSETTKAEKAPAKQETSATSAPSTNRSERTTRKKMSPLRRRVAQRLVEAQQNAAILTTFNEVDMTAIMELRKKHQDSFVKKNGIKLGFMSFFVKATVNALKEVPAINGQIDGEEIIQNNYYDIGVAVSTEKGLMVPVVRDCDQKNFAEIEQALGDYAQKARAGKIGIDDLQGGVFTISNGGVFGSLLSTPILNPPQSGILGMHTIQQRPVVVDGEIKIRPMMYLALSYDHRLVDGKEAVTFLVKIKEAIEEPTRLLLEV